MYKNYSSPLEATSVNYVSKALSVLIGAVVNLDALELKFGPGIGHSSYVPLADAPLRIKSPNNVNRGYHLTFKHDVVYVHAEHRHADGELDLYDVELPRKETDPRYFQIKKAEFADVLSLFLRKSYANAASGALYTDPVDRSAKSACRVGQFVTQFVTLLSGDKPFTVRFLRDRWDIQCGAERHSWYPPNPAMRLGTGNGKTKARRNNAVA